MIERVIISISVFLFGALIGLIVGQRSIWRFLRKKGVVIIDNWRYTGEKIGEENK